MNDLVSLGAEAELTEAQVLALIEAVNSQHMVWHVQPVNSGATILRPIQVRATTGGGLTWASKVEGHSFIITSAGGAANKIIESAYTVHLSDDPLEIKLNPGSDLVKQWQQHVNRIECFLGIYVIKANLTATQYVALEFGTLDVSAPVTEAAVAASASVQLRWQASTDSWFIYCNLGDSATPGVSTALTGVTGIYGSDNVPHGVYAALEWDPINGAVRAYINGKLGATYSGASVPTSNGIGIGTGATGVASGVFATTGSSASGAFSAVYVNGWKHTVKDFLAGVT